MKKRHVILTLLLACMSLHGTLHASNFYESYQADGAIVSSPLVADSCIFFGTLQGSFYAIHAITLSEMWRRPLGGAVKSSPCIKDSVLFIEATDTLYALSKRTGVTYWKVSLATTPRETIDAWDYHHASPLVVSDTVYIGSSDGNLLGYHIADGSEVFRFTTINQAAIRATPVIHENTIYFGDWLGKMYAVSTVGNLIWSWDIHASEYNYAWSTSSILGDMVYYQGNLYFGARNSHLLCLNASNGAVEWSYNDPNDGWISGTPRIMNDTLFIGGSDTESILAFNAHSGMKYWETATGQNCFGRLGYSQGYLAAVTGNSYDPDATGQLHILNSTTGAMLTQVSLGSNSFTSAIWEADLLLAGNNDGKLYKFNLRELLPGYYPNQLVDETAMEPQFNLIVDRSKDYMRVLSSQGLNQKALLSLYSLSGLLIRKTTIHDGVLQMPIYDLPHGLYIGYVVNGKQQHAQRVLL